jgi:hypothetical protein
MQEIVCCVVLCSVVKEHKLFGYKEMWTRYDCALSYDVIEMTNPEKIRLSSRIFKSCKFSIYYTSNYSYIL